MGRREMRKGAAVLTVVLAAGGASALPAPAAERGSGAQRAGKAPIKAKSPAKGKVKRAVHVRVLMARHEIAPGLYVLARRSLPLSPASPPAVPEVAPAPAEVLPVPTVTVASSPDATDSGALTIPAPAAEPAG